MWALRRASLPLRNQGFNLRASCASCIKSMPSNCVQQEAGISESPQTTNGGFLLLRTFYHSGHAGSLQFTVTRRELSSQADVSSTKEQDDEFSELEAGDGKENLMTSELDLSDDNEENVEETHHDLELSDIDTEPSKKLLSHRRAESDIFNSINAAKGSSVHSVMDKLVKEGKELDRQQISLAMLKLRKRAMFARALQLSEWVQSKSVLEFTERDYASRLDLIGRVHGLQKAEFYIDTIPKSFRGELVYRTFLAICVRLNNLKKAEETFNKMKDLGFPVTSFTCNQLLILYKRNDRKKIADVLLLMENENVKPSPFTYMLLIDIKGQAHDIGGMDQIVETMEASGFEPNIHTKEVLARHYIEAGLQGKAEAMLKEMEGENLKAKSWVCQYLLPLYADLGKADEVGRIWRICESNSRFEDCLAAIEAFGKVKKIEEAEAVFEMMRKKWKLTDRNCSAMLKVYAACKMVSKGKDLIKQMADKGCQIGPSTWDALVTLYVQVGEVEKADSLLRKLREKNHLKPLYSSYIAVMEQYAKQGNIHNAEKIFHVMKQVGYAARARQYQILVRAYINAKLPAYGIRDRLKADNVFPNRGFANQLSLVDGFRKTPVSDLLD